MKLAKIGFAAGLLLAAAGWTDSAVAKPHFSFGFHGGGLGFHFGGHHGYHYYPYYYSPYYYSYRPYRYRRYNYRRSRGYGRCGHWRRACARNWGYGGSNFYGCLRYHGCR